MPKTDGICWNYVLNGLPDSDEAIRRDLFMWFKVMILGPVTQFVTFTHMGDCEKLSSLCIQNDYRLLLQELVNTTRNLSPNGNRFLSSSRILQASTFAAIEVEKRVCVETGKRIRRSIGVCLSNCANTVKELHDFYSSPSVGTSSALYATKWEKTDAETLQNQMTTSFPHPRVRAAQNCLEGDAFTAAMTSGHYFPANPQVSPIPFDIEGDGDDDEDDVVNCNKDYSQRQKFFTPGAITLCCSCAHPIIKGMKVLSRHEGPRAVLNTIISRCLIPPRYIIYDYSCGLYASAVHTLPWALKDTTIVCDRFHAVNHNCSPGYLPSCHTDLNSTNTVAHEQRNRAIQELGKTLRNCSQKLYIAMLGFQTIILNIRSQSKGTTIFENRPKLTSEYDMEWCYFHCLHLRCKCCTPLQSIQD